MNITVWPSAHEYTRAEDDNRINRAEMQAEQQSKEARIKRRLEKKRLKTSKQLQEVYSMELGSMIRCK